VLSASTTPRAARGSRAPREEPLHLLARCGAPVSRCEAFDPAKTPRRSSRSPIELRAHVWCAPFGSRPPGDSPRTRSSHSGDLLHATVAFRRSWRQWRTSARPRGDPEPGYCHRRMRLVSRLARGSALAVAVTLLLVVATAGAAGGDRVTHEDGPPTHRGYDAAFVVSTGASSTAAVRLHQVPRQESVVSHRSAKDLRVVVAVLAALVAAGWLSSRRVVNGHGVRPAVALWWSGSGGRAPPAFQLSVP